MSEGREASGRGATPRCCAEEAADTETRRHGSGDTETRRDSAAERGANTSPNPQIPNPQPLPPGPRPRPRLPRGPPRPCRRAP